MSCAERIGSGKLPFQLQPTTTHPLKLCPELPQDLLKTIFGLLSMQDLYNVAKVCKTWQCVAKNTHLSRFQQFQTEIQESLALHLKPEQRKQLKEGLEKAASLFGPDALESFMAGAALPELKRLLIEALQPLDGEHLENLNLMVKNRFYGCDHLFGLARLSQTINSLSYLALIDNSLSHRPFQSPAYLELEASIDTWAKQDPDGVLEIAKGQQILEDWVVMDLHRRKGDEIVKQELHKMRMRTQTKKVMLQKLRGVFLGRGEIKKAFAVSKLMFSKNFYSNRFARYNEVNYLDNTTQSFLHDVISAFAERRYVKEIIEATQLLFQADNSWDTMVNVLTKLASSFAKTGDLEGFLKIIDSINDKEFKEKKSNRLLSDFCKHALRSDHVEAAFDAVHQIRDNANWLRNDRLVDIATHFLAKGEIEKPFKIVKEIPFRKRSWLENQLKRPTDDKYDPLERWTIHRDRILLDISNSFLDRDEVNKALEAARLISSATARNKILEKIRFSK